MAQVIVVVEDDFIIALDLRGVLESLGFEVITNVVNIDQAKVAITQYKPDLVLIDIALQKGDDGISIGKYLLDRGNIPYIYISGQSDKFTMERVKETKPGGFIVKPFKLIDVITTVGLVLSNFTSNQQDINSSLDGEKKVTPYFLKEIVSFVEENIDKKITVSELAEMSRWKEQHFIRVFFDYIGETPYQFVLRKKVIRAKTLICETDNSISGISFDLGFQSYGNFCNAFKKIIGQTPTKFRKVNSKYKLEAMSARFV
jgi:AraC-like DNA-binding protein